MNFFFAWGKFDSLYIKYNDACVQLRLLRFELVYVTDDERERFRGIERHSER